MSVNLDLNDLNFQKDFFGLEKKELATLVKTFKKLSQMNWQEVYKDQGLKWEKISSKTSKEGQHIYSLRFSQKYRATALREGNSLRLLTLHCGHDSAY